MIMEIAEGQRFPRQFVQVLTALGAAAVLFMLFRLPVAQFSFPLFLVTLLAVHVSARFDAPAERGGWRFPFAQTFALFSMLVFDGEAAVLLAAAVALCTTLPEGRDFRIQPE